MKLVSEFEVLDNPVREKIIKEFFKEKEILNYKHIKELVEQDTTRPDYHLNILVESDFLERTKGRGNYELNKEMIQPLRKKYNQMVPICIIGGLGLVSLFEELIEQLKEISILPKKYIILTSEKIKKEFEEEKLDEVSEVEIGMELFDYKEVLRGDYERIYTEAKKLIEQELFKYEVICELTGGTKLVTIALNELADNYHLRKIYYNSETIKWL